MTKKGEDLIINESQYPAPYHDFMHPPWTKHCDWPGGRYMSAKEVLDPPLGRRMRQDRETAELDARQVAEAIGLTCLDLRLFEQGFGCELGPEEAKKLTRILKLKKIPKPKYKYDDEPEGGDATTQ